MTTMRKKISVFARRLILIAFLILSLNSCDLFLLSSMARVNFFDPKVSLFRYDVYSYGNGEIFVAWNWLDQEKAYRDNAQLKPEWDKIVVKHRKSGFPTSRIGGIEISMDSSQWYKVFSDLDYDRDHHFALWPHEKGGAWLAPLYNVGYVEDPERITEPSVNINDIFLYALPPTSTYSATAATETIDENNWVLLYLPDQQYAIIDSATISNLVITALTGELQVCSLRWNDEDDDPATYFDSVTPASDRPFQRQYAVENFLEYKIDTISPGDDYDITGIFKRAMYHNPTVLVLKTEAGSSADIDFSATPSISYEGVKVW